MTDEIQQLADRTIDILRERGWHRGAWTDRDTGAVCLGAAIRMARFNMLGRFRSISDDEPLFLLRRSIRQVLAERGCWSGDYPMEISTWNDTVAQSAEDAILLVKEAVHS